GLGVYAPMCSAGICKSFPMSFGARTDVAAGASPAGIGVLDANSDGKADIVVANSGANNVQLLTGNGAGSFANGGTFGVGATPQGLAVGDVNNDGHGDVVVANSASAAFTVLLGNGVSFVAAASPLTSPGPTFVAI